MELLSLELPLDIDGGMSSADEGKGEFHKIVLGDYVFNCASPYDSFPCADALHLFLMLCRHLLMLSFRKTRLNPLVVNNVPASSMPPVRSDRPHANQY